ncbi:Periodic tryptophan protein 2 homolog [Sparassis crispa]|uniref:Periodic tryptophan protein 2 homolog n=1 Tax=Sparassis crispa TaxID=139825 RepID=A0A401GNU4_9APHY|nr:Periodic tryptophan protein 2 homolog [Sparassis crispa]GBE83819.1 Periodic tryptophan protein 2 homolog [Sparassis crispa]
MKANFKFSNLCGTVYRQGNIVFTPDGNSVLSPVGNRVSVFDLVNNKSHTFSFENRKNIAAIALSPDANVLISVDEDGRALLVNFRRGIVLHHFNFQKPVKAIKFSPDGKYIAATHDSHVQVWRTPNHLVREFAPFNLHRTYTGHHGEILSIEWSPDSKCFITTSRDMTARLFTLDPVEGFRPKTFAGHRDIVLGAYFSTDAKAIYTVSRDGAVFTWKAKPLQENFDSGEEEPVASTSSGSFNEIAKTRWGVQTRHYFRLPNTRVVCSTFHRGANLLVVGFSSGVFGLWELPSFSNLHTLSISQEKISAVAVNPSGEWLAFGARGLGQLLVWEWQSQSYVLKQQGHFSTMNTLAYAPDGQHIATGGDDGKVKVWNSASGFCFVTFSEHTAAVSAVDFAKAGQVLFSASLDGTVRAFDLVRYRNFRTFTSPAPAQFSCLAVDPSGEVVAAGSADTFEVFLWSVQTGRLLDVLSGHTAPVSSLAFSPAGNILASGSWDHTVRLWTVFGRSHNVDPFQLSADVLALAFRPDGKELVAASLDGQLVFLDVNEGRQTGSIDARRDAKGGRHAGDLTTAANANGVHSSIVYTADGRCVLAGGRSPHIALYDVREGVLLKQFRTSENLSLDGTQDFLDSRRLTDAGNLDLIDARGENSDLEDRRDDELPGARRGDMARRRYRAEVRTTCVRFAPTGRSWAASTTEGLLIYSLDEGAAFDPVDLALEVTPQAVISALAAQTFLPALVLAFRLNERALVQRVFAAVPRDDIRLVVKGLPKVYVSALLQCVAESLEHGPHLEFGLVWVQAVLGTHGRYLKDRAGENAGVLRTLWKALVDCEGLISKLCGENGATLAYLVDQMQVKQAAQLEDAEMQEG